MLVSVSLALVIVRISVSVGVSVSISISISISIRIRISRCWYFITISISGPIHERLDVMVFVLCLVLVSSLV